MSSLFSYPFLPILASSSSLTLRHPFWWISLQPLIFFSPVSPCHACFASWELSALPLEGLMLKLKLQYFGHLMRRVDSLEKTLMLGGIGGRRRRGRQRMRWLDGTTDSSDGHEFERTQTSVPPSGSWWWTGRPGVLRFMGSQRLGHDWVTELNWKKELACCNNDQRSWVLQLSAAKWIYKNK